MANYKIWKKNINGLKRCLAYKTLNGEIFEYSRKFILDGGDSERFINKLSEIRTLLKSDLKLHCAYNESYSGRKLYLMSLAKNDLPKLWSD